MRSRNIIAVFGLVGVFSVMACDEPAPELETVQISVANSEMPISMEGLGVKYRLQIQGDQDPPVVLPSGRQVLLSEILQRETKSHTARFDDLVINIDSEPVAMGDVTVLCTGEDAICFIFAFEINVCQEEVNICEPMGGGDGGDGGDGIPHTPSDSGGHGSGGHGDDIPSDGKG